MRVALVNDVWPRDAATPEESLERTPTLTGWAEAVRAAGASSVIVHQRFRSTARLEHNGVAYEFLADHGNPRPTSAYRGSSFCRTIARGSPDLVHVNGLDQPRFIRRLRHALSRRTALV